MNIIWLASVDKLILNHHLNCSDITTKHSSTRLCQKIVTFSGLPASLLAAGLFLTLGAFASITVVILSVTKLAATYVSPIVVL